MSWASRAKESNFYFETVDGKTNLIVENAMIVWTNFAGEPTRFNPQGGKRYFSLVIPEDFAKELMDQGWNIKARQPKDEDDDVLYTTEVIVNMDSGWPPYVCLCSERDGKKIKRRLNADTIGLLDSTRAKCVDLVINPHNHNVGAYRVKGYASAIMFTQAESHRFNGKYDDYIDDSEDDDDDALPF